VKIGWIELESNHSISVRDEGRRLMVKQAHKVDAIERDKRKIAPAGLARFIGASGPLGGRGLGKGCMGAGSKQALPFASLPRFGSSPRKAWKALLDGGTHF
jgi:hypothetical protein